MLCLIDAAPSQSLSHTLLSSHGRPRNRDATVWQGTLPRLCPNTPVEDHCLNHMYTFDSSNSYLNYKFLYSLAGQGTRYNLPPAIVLICLPSQCRKPPDVKVYFINECNREGKYSRCHLPPALQWNNKQRMLAQYWVILSLRWGYIRFMNCHGGNNCM